MRLHAFSIPGAVGVVNRSLCPGAYRVVANQSPKHPMSHSLSRPGSPDPDAPELGPSREGESVAPAVTAPLRGTIEVFDPAMCCPTGLCGPGVDPALLQIARDLRWLAAQGVTVARAGLGQEPQAFVANTRVSGLLHAFGDQALPAVLVNGNVLTHGRYPARDELIAALAQPGTAVAPDTPSRAARRIGLQVVEPGSDCCTPGSGCC